MPGLFSSPLSTSRQPSRSDILTTLLPNLSDHSESSIVNWLSSQLSSLPPQLLIQARTHGSASEVCNYDELALQGDAALNLAVIRLMRTFWPDRKVGAYTVSPMTRARLDSCVEIVQLTAFSLLLALSLLCRLRSFRFVPPLSLSLFLLGLAPPQIAKSGIVSDKSLALIGNDRLSLSSSLRVSKSHMAGGQHPIQVSMIATFLEALIGAIDEAQGSEEAVRWAQVVVLERVLEVCEAQGL